jgi:uncharacterized protein (TIGR02145 family)
MATGAMNFEVDNWSWGSGGNWIYIPFNEAFNTSSVSAGIWCKRNSGGLLWNPQPQGIAHRFQYGYNSPNGEAWVLGIDNSNGPNPNKIYSGIIQQAPSPAPYLSALSGQATSQDVWFHLAFSWDGATLKIYENGILTSQVEDAAFQMNTIGNSGISLGMSVQANGHWAPFDGDLDDFGIWNRALTAEEVMMLYLAAPPVAGCTDPASCNFNPEATLNDSSCIEAGCTDPAACNFVPAAGCDDGSCAPAEAVPGCMEATACNYDAAAVCAGPCVYPPAGSADCGAGEAFCGEGMVWDAAQQQCLIDPAYVAGIAAGAAQGACGPGTVWSPTVGACVPWVACPTPAWNPDSNADGAITIIDLLAFLSVFEDVDSDGDGIFDGQDDCVGIFDACGVCGGAGVDADADGVCDDEDTCVGALDACGVCNGPGPNIPVIDQIIFATDSVYLPMLGVYYVYDYSVDTLFSYVCPMQGCVDAFASNFNPLAEIDDGSCAFGPSQCGGQSVVTFDGYSYPLVGIGMQCWFTHSLRSDRYRNGDLIQTDLSDTQWMSTNAGAHTTYGEGASIVYFGSTDEEENLSNYGRLYNWYAVNDSRGLCPTGFHVPTDVEFGVLESYLGGSTVAGIALKSSSLNNPPWDGTNSSGFNALPAGFRGIYGDFNGMSDSGYCWSSTESGNDAISRYLQTGNSNSIQFSHSRQYGFSVRCLKDE